MRTTKEKETNRGLPESRAEVVKTGNSGNGWTGEKPKAVDAPPARTLPAAAIQASMSNNWANVSWPDRTRFVSHLCDSLNIPMPLNPFRFIAMKGVTVLYAPAEAFFLIANKSRVSIPIIEEKYDKETQIHQVKIRATQPDGTHVDNIGAIYLGGLTGQERANNIMKCVTKAQRRAIKSKTGLSVADEDDLAYMQKHGVLPAVTVESLPEAAAGALSEPTEDDIHRDELFSYLTTVKNFSVSQAKETIRNHAGKDIGELTAVEAQDVLGELQAEDEAEESYPESPQDSDVSVSGSLEHKTILPPPHEVESPLNGDLDTLSGKASESRQKAVFASVSEYFSKKGEKKPDIKAAQLIRQAIGGGKAWHTLTERDCVTLESLIKA